MKPTTSPEEEIYIASNKHLKNMVKIGISKNIKKRLTSLSTGVPDKFCLEKSFPSPATLLNKAKFYFDCRTVETLVHDLLSEYRVGTGEFFQVSADIAKLSIIEIIGELFLEKVKNRELGPRYYPYWAESVRMTYDDWIETCDRINNIKEERNKLLRMGDPQATISASLEHIARGQPSTLLTSQRELPDERASFLQMQESHDGIREELQEQLPWRNIHHLDAHIARYF